MKKVVYHIDEMRKWPQLLGNVKNMLRYYEEQKEENEIVVVVNGEAVTLYLADPSNEELMQSIAFMKQGVAFHVCYNSIKGWEIKEDTLPCGIVIVPAAVADIVTLEEQGFCYIKP